MLRSLLLLFTKMLMRHLSLNKRYFADYLRHLMQSNLNESEYDLEFEDRWLLNNEYNHSDDQIIDNFGLEILHETETEVSDSLSSQESQISVYVQTPPKIPRKTPETSLEEMKKVVSFCRTSDGSKNKWKIGSTRQRFKAIFRDCFSDAAVYNKLNRFEEYIQSHGSRLKKLKAIHNYVLLKFREAKQDYKTVHDRDLRYWAYEINNEVKMTAFKASTFWLLRFKTVNRIVSRKICRTVTPQFVKEDVDVMAAAQSFVTNVNKEKDKFFPYVYNTDQSGMQPEMHTGRTLAFKGSEQVTAKVQSTSATTHSYTIQPMVRIKGILHPILFICLQEASGRFPQKPR